MSRLFVVAILALFAAGGGCDKSAELSVASLGDPGEPTQAQPKLTTMKIYVSSEEMIAELALTSQQQRVGMMFRTNMAPNAGMLFPLSSNQRAAFWMKNCPYPLSAAYIDSDGIIQEIHDLEPHNTNSIVAASDNIRFVLETPRGWFQQHHIREGVSVATESGTLMHTFFEKRQKK